MYDIPKNAMKNYRNRVFFILLIAVFVWLPTAHGQTGPLTYPQIITSLGSKLPNQSFKTKSQLINFVIRQVQSRGVDKPLTAEREDDLRQAGATDELIDAIRANSPALPTRTSQVVEGRPQTRSANIPPAVSTVAASDSKTSRIGFVDSGQFADEKYGISKYVNAYRSLNAEFGSKDRELQAIYANLKVIEDELAKCNVNPACDLKAAALRQSEGQKLQRELEDKQKDARSAYDKRQAVVLGPIRNDISEYLQLTEKKNDVLLLDTDELYNPSLLLALNTKINITEIFIKFYNGRVNNSSAVPDLSNLMQTKIAVIDTTSFSDEKSGITKYVSALQSLSAEFKPSQAEINDLKTRIASLSNNTSEEAIRLQRELELKQKESKATYDKRAGVLLGPVSQQIAQAIQDYLVEKNIGFVLDSSVKADDLETMKKIANLPKVDITREFINYYNQLNR